MLSAHNVIDIKKDVGHPEVLPSTGALQSAIFNSASLSGTAKNRGMLSGSVRSIMEEGALDPEHFITSEARRAMLGRQAA
jgi:hypothetical protein